MYRRQSLTERLAGAGKMIQIGAGIILAGVAGAIFIYWLKVFGKFRVINLQGIVRKF